MSEVEEKKTTRKVRAPKAKKEEPIAHELGELKIDGVLQVHTGTTVTFPPPSEEEMFDNINDLDVAKKMLKIHQSACDRGFEYNLTFATVKKLMSYKKCYYTGHYFQNDGLFARSFDRVDSSKGYIEGNVVASTVDINQKKTNLSLDEITLLYRKLVLKEI